MHAFGPSSCVIYFATGDKFLDSKVHGANMGPIWGRQDPGGPMWATWTLFSGRSSLAFTKRRGFAWKTPWEIAKKQRLMVAWNTMQLLWGVVCAFSRFVKQYCGYILASGYLERKYISHSKHSIIWMQLWPTEMITLGSRWWEVNSRYDIP